MRALIVDDSRSMRMILRNLLKPLDIDCEESCDGNAAYHRLLNGPPIDLILLDWNMPAMDGIDLVRALQSCGGIRIPKVLMVTSEVSTAFMKVALECGVDEYLMKPFTREALLEKLILLNIE